MMKLLRSWNQNKKKILITIGVIAFVIIIIQLMNVIVRSQNQKNANNVKQNTVVANDITKPDESIISNNKLTQKEIEENSEIIEKFVNACNQKKIDEAYALLTDDCKSELYPTKEIFINNYINVIFKEQINYKLELWYSVSKQYTYQITYTKGNLLQTGGQASSSNFMDFITVIKQNAEYKLSINKFIKKENMSKDEEIRGIQVQINSKSIYVDYEIYHVTLQNNTEKTILLNDGKNANHLRLIGRSGSIFTSVISEVPVNYLTVKPQENNALDIKFNKRYMTEEIVEEMEIQEVYLDKEQYNAKQENADKITIKIKL